MNNRIFTVAYVGDIHGDIRRMYKYLSAIETKVGIKIDCAIQVGDFGIYLPPSFKNGEPYMVHGSMEEATDFPLYWEGLETAPIPTYVCPGNHEEYPVTQLWLRQPERMENLFLLPDGEVTVVEGMLRVGAIWGNYSYKSYKNPSRVEQVRKNHHRSRLCTHIYRPSIEKLKNAGRFDILITHDAPKGYMPSFGNVDNHLRQQLGLENDEHIGGCPGFLEIWETGQPEEHFFGHFHKHTIVRSSAKRPKRVTCLHCFNYNPNLSVEIRQYEMERTVGDDDSNTRSAVSSAAGL